MRIAPTTATFVKFKVVSPADKQCVGITEIELKKAVGTFTTNTTAKLAEVNTGTEQFRKQRFH